MRKFITLLLLFTVFAFAEWDTDPDYTEFSADSINIGKLVVDEVKSNLELGSDSIGFGIGTADSMFIFDQGSYSVIVGDNPLYVDCGNTAYFVDGIQAFADTGKSSGTALVRWKEVWALQLMTSSPDDADSVAIWDDGTNAIIDADNPLAINTSVNYAADAQGDDDYEVDIPGITALHEGLTVTFKANTLNTGGASLEITSVGDIDNIAKLKDQVLATGDILAGQIVVVVFDGSMWQMTSQLAQ